MKKILLLLVIFSISFKTAFALAPITKEPKELTINEKFTSLYKKWKYVTENTGLRYSSFYSAFHDCREFEHMISLGPQIVPFLYIKYDKENKTHIKYSIEYGISQLTKRRFKSQEDFLNWPTTRKNKQNYKNEFDSLYKKWLETKNNENIITKKTTSYNKEKEVIDELIEKTELKKAFDNLIGFGIDGLPFMIQKLKDGDYSMLIFIKELTDTRGANYTGTIEKRISYTLKWWEENKEKWLIPDF